MIDPIGTSGRTVGLVIGLGLLAACTTSQAGVGAADQQQDETACLRSSSGPSDQGYLLLPFEIDGPAFRRCMEVRGYVLEPVSAPRSTGR